MDAHAFFPLSQAFSLPARLELRFEEAPQEAGFQRLSDLLRGEFKNERVLGVPPPTLPPPLTPTPLAEPESLPASRRAFHLLGLALHFEFF